MIWLLYTIAFALFTSASVYYISVYLFIQLSQFIYLFIHILDNCKALHESTEEAGEKEICNNAWSVTILVFISYNTCV